MKNEKNPSEGCVAKKRLFHLLIKLSQPRKKKTHFFCSSKAFGSALLYAPSHLRCERCVQ